ncbi:MAG: aromatic ring-hydroxylating dioxygenase subunit alpha, partial [Alphaproteobacteria bacterium]|nr:aromatic ring-hydroxylating dioxygenase subunit alpha [Alphaproteobacteria bacterium]
MEQAKQVEILKELMSQVDEKRNVDAGVMYESSVSSYTCPDMAAREWDVFFRDHAQIIGLSGDLPNPGSFMTVDDFGTPVLACRDTDRNFRAFLNACRHRGVKLVTEERGDKTRFSCPFHAWTYDNSGALLAIPQAGHFGAVDKPSMGLIELPAEEKHGLLFVHPKRDGAIDVDAMLGGLGPEIANWRFQKMIRTGGTTITKRLNWKLANDTFGETYHFQKLHKNTLGQLFHGDNLCYEAVGRNHRFVFASRFIDSLREVPEEEWSLPMGATLLYFIFPNIQVIIGRGTTNLVKIYPHAGDPSHSTSRICHYFTENAMAAEKEALATGNALTLDEVYDFEARKEKVLNLAVINEVFDSTIEQEDYAMGERIQIAAESGELDKVIFGRNEPALHH